MEEELRIEKTLDYLIKIIDTFTTNKEYQINADMLSNDKNNYSLDKIPTASTFEKWIIGIEKHRDVYSFRSRKEWSADTIINLQNIGFFEKFEKIINSNNKKGVLPEIKGIESIECLNCGSMNNAKGHTAEYDIQIQITYRS